MSRVCVLGNATVDLIHRVERLPERGETVLAGSLLRCAGGKGLNQAVAAARTGARTWLVAPVGRDAEATFLADRLGGEDGLDVSWLVSEAPTDISSIWVARDGENMIVSSADCARSVTADHAGTTCADLHPGDVLLMQGNLPPDTTRVAAEKARERGALTLLNTAPIAWDMQSIAGLFHVVIANEVEAALLTDGVIGELGPALRHRGFHTAVVTLGARGALVFDGEVETAIVAPRVHAVDTAGAGDVMVGTLAGLLAQGKTMREATTIAVAAASLSVTRHGTTPSFPSRGEIHSLVAAAQR